MAKERIPLEYRFWPKVARLGENDCWLWMGHRSAAGYGEIRDDNLRSIGAHRASYQLIHGPIEDGMFVLHSCDNPSCVNPKHLRVGSHLENMRDRSERDRCARIRGSKHPHARLSETSVEEIRRKKSMGVSQKEIALSYGLSEQTISEICLRKTWKHVA